MRSDDETGRVRSPASGNAKFGQGGVANRSVIVWPGPFNGHFYRGFVVIPLIINVVINAVLPFLLLGHRDSLPVWEGPESMHVEVIGTAVLLPLLTTLICGWILRRQLSVPDRPDERATQVDPESTRHVRTRLGWLFLATIVGRGKLRGAVAFSLLAGTAVYLSGFACCLIVSQSQITLPELSLFKAVFAGVHGLWMTPMYAASVMIAFASWQPRASQTRP